MRRDRGRAGDPRRGRVWHTRRSGSDRDSLGCDGRDGYRLSDKRADGLSHSLNGRSASRLSIDIDNTVVLAFSSVVREWRRVGNADGREGQQGSCGCEVHVEKK